MMIKDTKTITLRIPSELDFTITRYLLSLREGGEDLTKAELLIRLIRIGTAAETKFNK